MISLRQMLPSSSLNLTRSGAPARKSATSQYQTSPVRVAIVGAGSIVSDIHVPAWRHLPGAEICAICDSDQARAEKVARESGVAVSARSLTELAERDIRIDAVAIATPPHTHEDIAAQALELGCHVLIEKPATLSARACSVLSDAAEAADLQAWAVHSYRYRDPVLKLYQSVRSGQIGRLELISIRSHGDAAFRQRQAWAWSEAPDRLLIYELGVHYVDLAILFAGPVIDIVGFHSSRDWEGNVTAVSALLRHSSATVTLLDLRIDCSNRFVQLDFSGSNQEAVIQLFPEHFALLRGQRSPITDLRNDFQRLGRFAVGMARDRIQKGAVKRRAMPHHRLFSQFLAGVSGNSVSLTSDLRSTIGTMSALDSLHERLTGLANLGQGNDRSAPK